MSPFNADSDWADTCAGCGASVYQEHITRGLAVRNAGRLLCPHCLEEQQDSAPHGTEPGALTLVEPEEPAAAGIAAAARSGIHGFSGTGVALNTGMDAAIQQRPISPGPGATRIRTFHCRLSEGAVTNLDQQVNAWLSRHPEIEIKFAKSVVGVWEGKHAEPNLILTLFY
jgi:hypothetical protein